MTEKLQHELDPSSPNSDYINRLESVKTSQAVTEEQTTDPNPFDPGSLVLDQSYLRDNVAKKVLLEVDVRRPGKDEFFRVHPERTFRLGPVAIISNRDDRTTYIVDPTLARSANLQHTTAILYTCINVDGVLFLWPVTVPGSSGGSVLAWHTSAVVATEKAMKNWIKLVPDLKAKNYVAFIAQGDIPEPEWPPLTMGDIVKLALKERHIKDYEHPVLRRLRGIL
jgi:hypothetical protein